MKIWYRMKQEPAFERPWYRPQKAGISLYKTQQLCALKRNALKVPRHPITPEHLKSHLSLMGQSNATSPAELFSAVLNVSTAVTAWLQWQWVGLCGYMQASAGHWTYMYVNLAESPCCLTGYLPCLRGKEMSSEISFLSYRTCTGLCAHSVP